MFTFWQDNNINNLNFIWLKIQLKIFQISFLEKSLVGFLRSNYFNCGKKDIIDDLVRLILAHRWRIVIVDAAYDFKNLENSLSSIQSLN